jgi:hypothetical protein
MKPGEEPEALWQTMLSLGSEAVYWVEEFLHAFHRQVLEAQPVPEGYATLVRAMFTYATSALAEDNAPSGTTRGSVWHHRSDPWLALLALDDWTQKRWQERHTDVVRALADLYEQWTVTHLRSGYGARAWARFLERPAAQPLLLRGIEWLDDAVVATHGHALERSGAADAVAALLVTIWNDHQAQVRRDHAAFGAFRGLQQHLVEQLHPVALDLQGQIGNTGSA